MPNGYTGTYHYWDGTYTGAGDTTVDGSPLSGGHGVLTDGTIATLPWYDYGSQYPDGPFVGWDGINPTITFHFASDVDITDVNIYVDNSDVGGVVAPGGAVVKGYPAGERHP